MTPKPAPNPGGRPQKYGEPTETRSVTLPLSMWASVDAEREDRKWPVSQVVYYRLMETEAARERKSSRAASAPTASAPSTSTARAGSRPRR